MCSKTFEEEERDAQRGGEESQTRTIAHLDEQQRRERVDEGLRSLTLIRCRQNVSLTIESNGG